MQGAHIPCIHIEVPGHPGSILRSVHHAGSRFDEKNKAGLAHLTEHLVIHSLLSNSAYHTTESEGIEAYARTQRETMEFTFTQLSDDLEKAIHHFENVFADFPLTESVTVQEKRIIEQELIFDEKDHNFLIHNAAMRQLFHGRSIAADLIGDKASRKSIESSDIQSFRDRYVNNLDECIVIIVEGTSFETQRKYFHECPLALPVLATGTVRPPEIRQNEIYLTHEHIPKDATQIDLYMRTCPVSDSGERPLFALLRRYLAMTTVSVLYRILHTERQLIYDLDTDAEFFEEGGYMQFTLETSTENAREVVRIVHDQLAKIRAGELDRELLEIHKKLFIRDMLLRAYTLEDVVEWYADGVLWQDTVTTMSEYADSIHKITEEDLKALALKYLQDSEIVTITTNAA